MEPLRRPQQADECRRPANHAAAYGEEGCDTSAVTGTRRVGRIRAGTGTRNPPEVEGSG